MTKPNLDRLASPVNPNGLFAEAIDGTLKEQFPDTKERLILAVADIKSFLVEVVGLDLDMADLVAARATQEVLAATDTDLTDYEVGRAIEMGSNFSTGVAVDRAIDAIMRD